MIFRGREQKGPRLRQRRGPRCPSWGTGYWGCRRRLVSWSESWTDCRRSSPPVRGGKQSSTRRWPLFEHRLALHRYFDKMVFNIAGRELQGGRWGCDSEAVRRLHHGGGGQRPTGRHHEIWGWCDGRTRKWSWRPNDYHFQIKQEIYLLYSTFINNFTYLTKNLIWTIS